MGEVAPPCIAARCSHYCASLPAGPCSGQGCPNHRAPEERAKHTNHHPLQPFAGTRASWTAHTSSAAWWAQAALASCASVWRLRQAGGTPSRAYLRSPSAAPVGFSVAVVAVEWEQGVWAGCPEHWVGLGTPCITCLGAWVGGRAGPLHWTLDPCPPPHSPASLTRAFPHALSLRRHAALPAQGPSRGGDHDAAR